MTELHLKSFFRMPRFIIKHYPITSELFFPQLYSVFLYTSIYLLFIHIYIGEKK